MRVHCRQRIEFEINKNLNKITVRALIKNIKELLNVIISEKLIDLARK
jgi:hypothetical protein